MPRKTRKAVTLESVFGTHAGVLLGILVISLIASSLSFFNSYELSQVKLDLTLFAREVRALKQANAGLATAAKGQEAAMAKAEAPAGMTVVYTDPETGFTFSVDPSGKYTAPYQYARPERTETGDSVTLTFVKTPAGTEDPKDTFCTAVFEISPRSKAVVTKDIVFRDPDYTVTTKDACGLTVDIKR